jgi:hypothetical protein
MNRTIAIGVACLCVGVLAFVLGRSDYSSWMAAAVVIGALSGRSA